MRNLGDQSRVTSHASPVTERFGVSNVAAASAPRGMSAVLRGALWMVGALLMFSGMAISVRELIASMGAFQILFLRSLVSLLLLLAILPWFGWRTLHTRHARLHLVRNLLHFGGQYAWVYAIALLPLATVFAIEFT